jgi:transmembrane sensor
MMQDNKARIQELFDKWFDGTLSDAERLELGKYAAEPSFEEELPLLLKTQWDTLQATEDFTLEDRQLLAQSITDRYPAEQAAPVRPVHRVHFLRKWGWAAAAAILILSVGAYLFTTNKKTAQPADRLVKNVDIPPGKDGAVLSLADGSQVLLDTIKNGTIALQGGAIAKVVNGALLYEASGDEVVYNTMSTPRGKQYHVILPDGTEVWLNAASSIRYPTVFKGKQRTVTMTGEAYFEVASLPLTPSGGGGTKGRMPFIVDVDGKAEVEVLGTHFNVDAYDNNTALSTTLLEGLVKVNGTTITPGQQARITNVLKVVNNADTEKVMAWKNGLFNFEGATLEEVMKQLERWYDIEVVYEKGVPDIEFGGEMTKNISLKGLLLVLEKSDIHFRLEGRRLIVLP